MVSCFLVCSGLVPLHNACSYGHYEVVELLLRVRGGGRWDGRSKGRRGEGQREGRGVVQQATVCVCVYTTSSKILVGITLSSHLYACDGSSFLSSHPLP